MIGKSLCLHTYKWKETKICISNNLTINIHVVFCSNSNYITNPFTPQKHVIFSFPSIKVPFTA